MALFSRKKRELAITFDDDWIRFIEASVKKTKNKHHNIVQIHHVSTIENDLIEDGRLHREKWEQLLKQHIKENKIKAKMVKVAIPNSMVIIRQQSMPDLPLKDIKQILIHEIGNTIHLPFQAPVMDVIKIDEPPVMNEEGEAEIKVELVAAPGQFIYPLVEGLKANKLKPLVIDIPALSLYRFFTLHHSTVKDEPILLASVTKKGVDMHILLKGVLGFTRHIPMAIEDFIVTDTEEKVMDAKTLLEKIQERENYQSFTSNLAYEIDRAVNFYQYTLNNRDKNLKGAWIASDMDFPQGFYDILQNRIDTQVFPLNYNQEEWTEEENKRHKGYEVGIGLLLRKVVDKNGN